jgi:hypothetical protein
MNKIKRIMLFPNGNMVVVGEDGKQITELQKGWIEMICEFFESKGVDPASIPPLEDMKDGLLYKPFRVESGWNWMVDRP